MVVSVCPFFTFLLLTPITAPSCFPLRTPSVELRKQASLFSQTLHPSRHFSIPSPSPPPPAPLPTSPSARPPHRWARAGGASPGRPEPPLQQPWCGGSRSHQSQRSNLLSWQDWRLDGRRARGRRGRRNSGREGGAALVGGEEEEEEDEEEEDGEDEFSKEVSCVGWRGGGKGGGGDVGERRWACGVMGMWCHGHVVPWACDAMGMWCHGHVVPWACGAMGMWCHGHVVEEMFKRAVAEGVAQDNVVLESAASTLRSTRIPFHTPSYHILPSFPFPHPPSHSPPSRLSPTHARLAYNRSFADCAGAMFRGMLNLAASQAAPGAPTKELLASTRAVVTRWTSLLRRFLKGTDDEVEVLLTFEEVCNESRPEFAPIFVNVLEALYDRDIVSEEAVMAWADEKQFADAADKVFVERSAAFIKWLKEAEEEESDDE
ncbi:unnamed protein product [Closterium sp. NIES-64]|nr:unnamed protein product [Closterium sp. NIES-64]